MLTNAAILAYQTQDLLSRLQNLESCGYEYRLNVLRNTLKIIEQAALEIFEEANK